MFQSLFSWMLLWKSLYFNYHLPIFEFQSLFSWMLLWKVTRAGPFREFSTSFNPCSLGCCSESCGPGGTSVWPMQVSILVLLDVALKVGNILAPVSERYVSILVLLDVALKAYNVGICAYGPKRFQSLFSWMLLWKCSATHAHMFGMWGFNPCSLGCCSESRR